MKAEQIGIGIIGCGTISDVYLTNITQHYTNLKLIACADMYLDKARQTQEKYNIPIACTVDELLSNDDIQIVLNLTIPAAHFDINMQILNAGKHLYCEKPLTLSFEDAKTVIETARSKGLMAASAPDTFLGAGAQTCRALLDEGIIGNAVGFTANMVCPGHELWHPAPGFYYKTGGGPMFDMGPYYLTTLVALLGPIKRVACFATSGRSERKICGSMMPVEVPTHYTAIIEFVCGVIGNMNMSFDVWDSDLPCMEIYGTNGAMTVPDPNMFGGPVKIYDGQKLEAIVEAETRPHPAKIMAMMTNKKSCAMDRPLLYPEDPQPRSNMRGLGVSDMAQALLDGRNSRLRPDISLHVVEALNAFEIAAQTNSIYEMTTDCQRPEPMPRGLDLWEAAK